MQYASQNEFHCLEAQEIFVPPPCIVNWSLVIDDMIYFSCLLHASYYGHSSPSLYGHNGSVKCEFWFRRLFRMYLPVDLKWPFWLKWEQIVLAIFTKKFYTVQASPRAWLISPYKNPSEHLWCATIFNFWNLLCLIVLSELHYRRTTEYWVSISYIE